MGVLTGSAQGSKPSREYTEDRAVSWGQNPMWTGLYPGGRTPCGAGLGQRIFAWGVETDGLDLICALRTDPEEVSHQ